MRIVTYLNSLSRVAAISLVLGGIAHAAAPSAGSTPTAKATFAGGCFWCMEPPYDELEGVISTISGYIGGTKKNPTYEEVSAGTTGHAEAVQTRGSKPRGSGLALQQLRLLAADSRQFRNAKLGQIVES